MKLQKDKWYVCIKSWSNDGWTKFYEGDLILCEKDNELKDCYNISHLFVGDEPESIFREATEIESNIANVTKVNIKEFLEDNQYYFEKEDTLSDIYQKGAKAMLRYIKANLNIKG